jgi:hypothetical protein
MEKIGYTVSGIKEICRHDDVNSYCRRHVRHGFEKPSKNGLQTSVDLLPKPKTLDDYLEYGDATGYKITDDGLITVNCRTCDGKGVVSNSFCPTCKGKGWAETTTQYSSLKDYVNNEIGELVYNSKTFKHLPYELGDLVRVKGNVEDVHDVKTKYGATVMVSLLTQNNEKVVFFSNNKWVRKLVKGSTCEVRGYVRSFGEYNNVPQTVLRQVQQV